MSLPQSLPKLLQAMRWNDRENVAQVSAFINSIHTLGYFIRLAYTSGYQMLECLCVLSVNRQIEKEVVMMRWMRWGS